MAEIGHLEDHSRSILAVTMVANDQRFVRSTLDLLIHDVGTWRGALIEDASITVDRPIHMSTKIDMMDSN